MLSAPEAGSDPMTDAQNASSDTPPDHLSNDPRSKFHDPAVLERGIGIRFTRPARNTGEEY